MPTVREPSDESPQKLEVVEVRPGVHLKLNARDKAAYFAEQDRAAKAEAEWRAINDATIAEARGESVAAADPEPDEAADAEPDAEPTPKKARSRKG